MHDAIRRYHRARLFGEAFSGSEIPKWSAMTQRRVATFRIDEDLLAG
jgi:hypothetical protein